jgi:hypothetical protein
MSANNGQHKEERPLVSEGLQGAADRFNALLDRYGPRPSKEELLAVMNKEMPRYSLYMVCGLGLVAGLLGLAFGLITHAGAQTGWLFLFWGIVAGLLTRQGRWAQSYVFGATMFAARRLLPWENLWNGVKYYRLAFETMKESYATIEEAEALKKALEGKPENKKGRKWWKPKTHVSEKKL